MLKTLKDGKNWLISQPDHAEVSAFLATHWGNGEFARPGYYADSPDPERLRAETLLAIAEHDNGWWEWEADPELSESDGFPLGLSELLKNREEGMNRWRLGIPRLCRDHPYASLLVSFHAYWLYAHGYHDDPDPAFTHLLYWKGSSVHPDGKRIDAVRAFLEEVKGMQDELITRLQKDPATAVWVDPNHLNPHVRLLQHMDGLSLSLCSALIRARSGESRGLGGDPFDLLDVPRRSWEDRVTVTVKPAGERRIACLPYPFDADPLPVMVRARVIDRPAGAGPSLHSWWHAEPKQMIRFEYCSG